MQENNREFEIYVPASPVESVNIKNGRYLFDIELFFEFESMLFCNSEYPEVGIESVLEHE